MKRRYEMTDKEGRYLTGEYDDEKGLLMVTMYLYPNSDVPIEETLKAAGFTVTSKMTVEKPRVLSLTKGQNK